MKLEKFCCCRLFFCFLATVCVAGCKTQYGYEFIEESSVQAAAPQLHKLGMECNLTVSMDEEYKTDSYETNSKIDVNIKESNEEYLNLVINSKNTISKYDKIKESDQTIIMNKLMETTLFKKIMSIYYQNMNQINDNGLEISGIEEEITF